jgi:hypothetical protein
VPPITTYFRVRALDARLDVGFRAGRAELEAALEGHALVTAELVGTSAGVSASPSLSVVNAVLGL